MFAGNIFDSSTSKYDTRIFSNFLDIQTRSRSPYSQFLEPWFFSLPPGAAVHSLLLQSLLRQKTTTHAESTYVLSFFDRLQWRKINLSVNNLFLLTSAVGFGRLALLLIAPGIVI